jgi:hypothetical protein
VKVGDLVKMCSDPHFIFGYGIVLELNKYRNRAKIYWFDDCYGLDAKPIDWQPEAVLEVMSESW